MVITSIFLLTIAGAIWFCVYIEVEKRRYLAFLDSINDDEA
jgi:hypothetical protein